MVQLAPGRKHEAGAAKKIPVSQRPAGINAFLLSHAKAPLREEKRDAATETGSCTI